MNRKDLATRVRQYTRDTNKAIFKEGDVIAFINEAVDRLRSVPEFKDMRYLTDDNDEPVYLPSEYHYLIAVYATARCFEQDERHFQGAQKMNEFEAKLAELRELIQSGEVVVVDEDGEPATNELAMDAVVDVYFNVSRKDSEVLPDEAM